MCIENDLDNFQIQEVDGRMLLQLDEGFLMSTLKIMHALRRKKLLRLVERLKQHQVKVHQVR